MKIAHYPDIAKLDVSLDHPDPRRDLHMFIRYLWDREVKRGHRDNRIGKSDAKRLAKMFSDPKAESEVDETGGSAWVDFVDHLALLLELVKYDTQGRYAGYTSSSRTYPDNFIEVESMAYDRLLALPLARQEKLLLDALVESGQANQSEFYVISALGRLDQFNFSGSATGVVPLLDFASARRFLLNLMAGLPTDEWLSVESLVEYLKTHHRYFLIPRNPKFANTWDSKNGRYGNFRDGESHWSNNTIPESAPDAFERVEGRYVERFLEGIPNLLGYVDVAYTKQWPKGISPCPPGCLTAFRVRERMRRSLGGTITEPTVRVTPSFEVYVQSDFYPASVMGRLEPICELVSEDTTIVYRLDRRKVAEACAADPKLDVPRLLESLSTEPLSANVSRELSDWSAHSEKFVLYRGYALLETDRQPDLKQFRVENIATGMEIVKSPAKLFDELERQQLAPMRIQHGEESLTPLPSKAQSKFPRISATGKAPRAKKTKVTLMRVTRVQLVCPDNGFLDRLLRLLAEANCPVESDRKRLSLAYSHQYEKEVNRAIGTLKNEFEVTIDNR